jgi:AraC-like DNA-binding protein
MDGTALRPGTAGTELAAWRPAVAGITEVLHARFIDHAYPMHTHDAWTLLIVDDGVIRYDIDRHERGVVQPVVALLPPDVPHDGRAATSAGFRKRVAYLGRGALDDDLIGAAVDRTELADAGLRRQVDQLHRALAHAGDAFEVESRLALILDRIRRHLRRVPGREPNPTGVAAALRELLDENTVAGITLRDAAATVDASPTHLVRAFTRQYGLPPHRYLVGRRIDLARRLLLEGMPSAEVAVSAGFYDQAHLTRHFRRYLGVGPSRFRFGRPAG